MIEARLGNGKADSKIHRTPDPPKVVSINLTATKTVVDLENAHKYQVHLRQATPKIPSIDGARRIMNKEEDKIQVPIQVPLAFHHYHRLCPIKSVEGHIYLLMIVTCRFGDSPPATSVYVLKNFVLLYSLFQK
jgi:hypothetical protein